MTLALSFCLDLILVPSRCGTLLLSLECPKRVRSFALVAVMCTARAIIETGIGGA